MNVIQAAAVCVVIGSLMWWGIIEICLEVAR
jgi:hypothetical protein